MLIMGAPGAGKGTQATALAEAYSVPAISTGDIFRANIRNATELGVKVKAIIEAGEYVPDDVTEAIVVDRLLKLVYRRILYSMGQNNLTPDKPYRKSATIVGDVLGKYHPHGDTAVYDALVKMAQDFSMRYPLDIHFFAMLKSSFVYFLCQFQRVYGMD